MSIEKAAAKARVSADKIVGPFRCSQKPARSGLYLRQSKKTGDICWAFFDAGRKTWGLYSDSKAGALRRSTKPSKQSLVWFGYKGNGV